MKTLFLISSICTFIVWAIRTTKERRRKEERRKQYAEKVAKMKAERAANPPREPEEGDDDYYVPRTERDPDYIPSWYKNEPSRYESSREEESYTRSSAPDKIEYIPQRLGGNGWLRDGNSFSSISSAINSVESSKRKRPNCTFRVAEQVNGRIVGTVYNC